MLLTKILGFLQNVLRNVFNTSFVILYLQPHLFHFPWRRSDASTELLTLFGSTSGIKGKATQVLPRRFIPPSVRLEWRETSVREGAVRGSRAWQYPKL
jgi:hypothetical protein